MKVSMKGEGVKIPKILTTWFKDDPLFFIERRYLVNRSWYFSTFLCHFKCLPWGYIDLFPYSAIFHDVSCCFAKKFPVCLDSDKKIPTDDSLTCCADLLIYNDTVEDIHFNMKCRQAEHKLLLQEFMTFWHPLTGSNPSVDKFTI